MNTCDSWEHGLLAWAGFSNEPCPLCVALKAEDIKDRQLERLRAELEEVKEKLNIERMN